MNITTLAIRLIITALLTAYVLSFVRAHKLSTNSHSDQLPADWEVLVSRICPVRMEEITYLARRQLADSTSAAAYRELYLRIGGKEGLRRMRKNSRVLIELAAYTEAWTPGASRDVVLKLRDEGFRLKRAAWTISLLSFIVGPGRRGIQRLHDLSFAYWNMTEHLLTLYKSVHIARHDQLAIACGLL